ncbi:MAG: bifunctional [glutamine synthetase] adenylyltransferase/[glutamine synthetase]-adenylyl-L-tyrosine phosphorylase [Methylocystis sp.]
MQAEAIINNLQIIISTLERTKAELTLTQIIEKDEQTKLEFLNLFKEKPNAREFLLGVVSTSKYLSHLALQDPPRLLRVLSMNPETQISNLIENIKNENLDDEAKLMHKLRCIKAEAAMIIGLADLAKTWDTLKTTHALTIISQAVLSAAIQFTLREAAIAGKIELLDIRNPERGSGWIFLGMGKMGAFELNYSSDIDLIVFFDRHRARLTEPEADTELFVKMTKRVVKIISDYTENGYVFRIDLRLRPDPSATPIALPLEAAMNYYESMGQNWERAAFIKARPVAGDVQAGESFLNELAPFIWRKNFDFAAIADVHSIKRQIHAHKGHASITVNGHNIKLGRGGIREVEFFVQTQQLILGGRNPELRGRETLKMLDQLTKSGWIEEKTRSELKTAYIFLRDVEHRIQMVADEQTHCLPESDDDVAKIGRMMGYTGYDDFAQNLTYQLTIVQNYYSQLFEKSPELTTKTGNLVFTGDEDDPETLASLMQMGYDNPKTITEIIRSWHFGRYPATRSTIARERLTELTPALLERIAHTQNADQAFIAFDNMIKGLPSGVQLFSLLAANPKLLALLSAILGASPKLAETVSRRPRIFGALLEPEFYKETPTRIELAERLSLQIKAANNYEEKLDRARIFGQEQKFLIGVRIITGSISVANAGAAYTNLAEVILRELFHHVLDEFSRENGYIENGEVAVIAMGKLGGFEMTAASDLDLILIYKADPAASSIGCEKGLSTSHYYARLTQRLITALSAQTTEGILYETDFRLRPSGNKGPIAISIERFIDYQATEAWTWEHMALTRARVIVSSKDFNKVVEEAIHDVLIRPRDSLKLTNDILSMRQRLAFEKNSKNLWELKQTAGGIVDIEFVTQYLLLLNGARHHNIFSTSITAALTNLSNTQLIAPNVAENLIQAFHLYQGLTQIIRLSIDETFNPEKASLGLVQLLLAFTSSPNLSHLEACLIEKERQIREIFVSFLGEVTP